MKGLDSSTLARITADVAQFQEVVLNGDEWNDLQDLAAAQRRPGWRRSETLVIQFDGEAHEFYPDKPVILPRVVAQHAIKSATRQPRLVNPDNPKERLNEIDRYGEVYSMVEVVRENVVPGQGVSEMSPASAGRKCPYCRDEVPVVEFVDHLAEKHAGQVSRRATELKLAKNGAAKQDDEAA